MKLALFDLDHTLLDGDTNILWIDYLIAQGLADSELAQRQQHYMELYAREQLDMQAYMRFHIEIFACKRISEWQPIVADFMARHIVPRLAPQALQRLEQHRAGGDCVAIVTATNAILARALGDVLEVPTIASEVEVKADRVTGRTLGLPSFRAHKIARVEEWLAQPLRSDRITMSHFYSDSANDLPLLLAVTHPVAVNPDPKLKALAEQYGWPQACWRAPAELAVS